MTTIKNIAKLSCLSVFFLFSCQKSGKKYETKITKQEAGFGYQILKKNKVLINQPFIPAIQGNKTFKTEEDAQKTANLVVTKIDKYSLPKISVHELDSMRIEY